MENFELSDNAKVKYSKLLLSKQSHIIDDFWEDCFSPQNKKNNGEVQQHKKKENVSQKLLNSFYEKHPELYQEVLEEQREEHKRRCAEARCISMYAFAIQQQNYQKALYDNNIEQKTKAELEQCTWKPNLNKTKKSNNTISNAARIKTRKFFVPNRKHKSKSQEKNLRRRKSPTFCKIEEEKVKDNDGEDKENKQSQDKKDLEEQAEDEYSFHPRVNSNPNLRKMFSKSLLSNRENAEFIMRYSKARENHLFKRSYLLSSKDKFETIGPGKCEKKNISFNLGQYQQSLHNSLYEIQFEDDN